MLQVDGAQQSGSGTIVRNATAIAALLGVPLHLFNIRARRDSPGLRPQHLRALEALTQLSGGRLEGGEVGAREIRFQPGEWPSGGSYEWDIGTAGSTTMLALTLLPLCCFAQPGVRFRVSGGLFQDFAPSAFHMKHILFPALSRMGVAADIEILRPGYVPRGGGIIEVAVAPVPGQLHPLRLLEGGQQVEISGVALSSRLHQRRVSQRMAERCQQVLRAKGYEASIEIRYDDSALQAGAALALFARTSTGCLLGADQAGQPRRTSEEIGSYVARTLMEDLASGATVDRFLADQLILYAALARGVTSYLIPRPTEHIETNLWLVETLLGARVTRQGQRLDIEGIGYAPGMGPD